MSGCRCAQSGAPTTSAKPPGGIGVSLSAATPWVPSPRAWRPSAARLRMATLMKPRSHCGRGTRCAARIAPGDTPGWGSGGSTFGAGAGTGFAAGAVVGGSLRGLTPPPPSLRPRRPRPRAPARSRAPSRPATARAPARAPAPRADRADRPRPTRAPRARPSRPRPHLRLRERALELRALARSGPREVSHPDRRLLVRGEERRRERDVADAAAREAERRELRRIDPLRRRPGGEHAAPDLLPLVHVREREVDDEADPPRERLIQGIALVRGEDREAAVGLHALQEVADLDVGIAVVAVLDLGALAEERVRLVEEQDRAAALRRVEHPAEVLLRLPDVLRDDLAEVDPVEVELELEGEHLRGHRLAGAAHALEERAHAEPAQALAREAPRLVHALTAADMGRHLAQDLELRRRQDDVVPARDRLDPLREVVELRTRLRAAGAPQRLLERASGPQRVDRRRRDRLRVEVELPRQRVERSVERGSVAAEHLLPEEALLVRARPRDVDLQSEAAAEPRRVRGAHEDGRADGVDERGEAAQDVRLRPVVELDEEDGARERGLPLPQAREEVAVGGMGRQVGGVRDVQAPPGVRGCTGGDRAPRSCVGAREADVDEDGQLLRGDRL